LAALGYGEAAGKPPTALNPAVLTHGSAPKA
jgi:glyoxylate/hydroxypyruvate/2-ketogluconate reductase